MTLSVLTTTLFAPPPSAGRKVASVTGATGRQTESSNVTVGQGLRSEALQLAMAAGHIDQGSLS